MSMHPHIDVNIDRFTLTRRVTYEISILEAENRFCSNMHRFLTFTEQGLNTGKVQWSNR